jgi:hypothetical protein
MHTYHPAPLSPSQLLVRGQSLGPADARHAAPSVPLGVSGLLPAGTQPVGLSRIQSAPPVIDSSPSSSNGLHQGELINLLQLSFGELLHLLRHLKELTQIHHARQTQEASRHRCSDKEEEKDCRLVNRGDWWLCTLSGSVHYCTKKNCSFYHGVSDWEAEVHCSVTGVTHGAEDFVPVMKEMTDSEMKEREDVYAGVKAHCAYDPLGMYARDQSIQRNGYLLPYMPGYKEQQQEKKQSHKAQALQKRGVEVTASEHTEESRLLPTVDLRKLWQLEAFEFMKVVLGVDRLWYDTHDEWYKLVDKIVLLWLGIRATDTFKNRTFSSKKFLKISANRDVYPLLYHVLVCLYDVKEGGRTVLCATREEPLSILDAHPAITEKTLPRLKDLIERLQRNSMVQRSQQMEQQTVHNKRTDQAKQALKLQGSAAAKHSEKHLIDNEKFNLAQTVYLDCLSDYAETQLCH